MGGNEFLNKCFELDDESMTHYAISNNNFTPSPEIIRKFQNDQVLRELL